MNSLTGSQQQAIAARGNVLVVAGAGTGKTSTLVQRCMALLDEGCSLENILMVTFTEAAAVEMRGRIREALQGKVTALEAEELAGEGAGAPREHFQKQLALLDTALISTLHGFCLQLVREHFYELGIDPDVSVLDEQQTRPLIEQLLDSTFERHYAGQAAQDRAVQKLVRVQGRGSDERIRALILKLHRYAQSLADPDQWIEAQRAIFSHAAPEQWREWFVEGVQSWRSLWQPVLGEFSGNAAVRAALTALQSISDKASFAQIGEAIQAIKAADEDEKNWPRGSKKNVRDHIKDFFEEVEFLVSLTPRNEADPLAEDWELVRHDMLALLVLTREFSAEFSRAKRELGGMDFADLEQFALRVLRDPASGTLTPAALQWQRQLEHVFVDEYQDINAAQDKIIEALSRSFGVPPPDGAGAEPPEGETPNVGNRFLVGDVKQSIYRFRLADPTIFRGYERLWGSGFLGAPPPRRHVSPISDQGNPPAGRRRSHDEGCAISLAENFRSRQGILDFINPLFRALMREEVGGVAYEELNFGNPSGRADLASTPDSAPRVEFHLIARADRETGDASGSDSAEASEVADLLVTEREARLVGLRLRELKEQQHTIWDKAAKQFRPVQWRDMAVLLRSPASRVEAFAKEFASLGIPIEAARGGFFESTEISDLVSLLKLLDNPLQDIPLLAVLRSPLVGMSVSELAEIRASETPQDRAKFFWLAARRFHQRAFPGSAGASPADTELAGGAPAVPAAWRKLNEFFTQLNRWRELVRHSSLSHCLETALAETHYELLLRAGPRGEQQFANVRRLLDLAREYDPYQRQGLFRFLRFIKAQEETPTELEPSPESRDAVRLTSIHKSKGLEFPVVALAGMGWQFNFRDLHEGILLDQRYGLCPKVSPTESDQRYPSLPHWLARRRQQRELLGEELRLLYVAMTRARDTLVLTATSRKGDGQWPSTEPRAIGDRELLAARSYLDWLKLWLPQATRSEDWTGDREGKSQLLSWKIYDESDERLALPEESPDAQPAGNESEVAVDEAALAETGRRVAWEYASVAATEQRAKTSVTELRRGRAEEEAGAARFVRRNVFTLTPSIRHKLSAAEVGVAHHRFLQRVSLSETGDATQLKREAARLNREGWLSDGELASLDFKALAKFWETDFGRKVSANAAAVQRELQFTAGLSTADLAALKLDPPANLPADEIVVVQGVVDLAVILPGEIWIVDFKTDAVTELELAEKVTTYEPQLRLYALALERIYRRPVTESTLFFLSLAVAVPVRNS